MDKEISQLSNKNLISLPSELRTIDFISSTIGDFLAVLSDQKYIDNDKLRASYFDDLIKKVGFEDNALIQKLRDINNIHDQEEQFIEIDNFIFENPTYIDGYYVRAMIYKKRGYLRKAIADYDHVIKLCPTYSKAYHNKGIIYSDCNDFQAAIICYKEALRLNPNQKDSLNNLGIAYRDAGDYNGSIACFTKAIEIDPLNYRYFINRGNSYGVMTNYEKAIDDYTVALELNPYLDIAYNNRTSDFIELRKYKEAKQDINFALEISPDLAEAFHTLGNLKYALGELTEACLYWRKAKELGCDRSDINLQRYCDTVH